MQQTLVKPYANSLICKGEKITTFNQRILLERTIWRAFSSDDFSLFANVIFLVSNVDDIKKTDDWKGGRRNFNKSLDQYVKLQSKEI